MIGRSSITGKPIPGATGVTLLGRLRGGPPGPSAPLLTAESLTSIDYTVTDTVAGTILATGTFPNGSVLDSLVTTDPRWTQDSQQSPSPLDGSYGYNFLATLASSIFPVRTPAAAGWGSVGVQPTTYQVDVVFTPVSGQPWRLTWRWQESIVYG